MVPKWWGGEQKALMARIVQLSFIMASCSIMLLNKASEKRIGEKIARFVRFKMVQFPLREFELEDLSIKHRCYRSQSSKCLV